jgi:LmbE family N-acetylglucosaminyl deacetylase
MAIRTFAATVLLAVSAALSVGARQQDLAVPDDFVFSVSGSRWVQAVISTASAASADPRQSRFEVAWPETGDDWNTALLAIGVRTAPVTENEPLPMPYLSITTGAYSARQYFSAGETGTRWLNLSHIPRDLPAGTRITIDAVDMEIGSGPTTLRLFAGRAPAGHVLVLAPHPDDAEIAAFALYAGHESTVATVTSGNAGSPTYEAVFEEGQEAEQYQFKGRVRTIDSITVPFHGGVPPERALNLGYFDARLGEMYLTPDAVVPEMYGPNTDIGVYRRYNVSPLASRGSRHSTWTNLVDDIEALVRAVDPDIIAAPHPQLDDHRDHQFTTVALVEALARIDRDVPLFLYTNHADRNRYPYGPAGTLVSLPPVPGPVDLDSVCSLPVSLERQREKLFALESMHDLRYSPTRQYQLAAGDGRSLAPEKEGPDPDISYLRRGPRANEIFFVYDRASVRKMIDAFLAPWREKR